MTEATIDKGLEEAAPANGDEPKRRRGKTEEQNEAVVETKEERAAKAREEELAEAQKALDALAPQTKPVRWVIGKSPEHGGTEKQYSVYVQDKLPWMARQQFFAMVSRTFSQALKASGGTAGGMSDIFGGDSGGSIIERGRRLTQRDMTDATQFMSLALELVGYSPGFLVDCYMILLDVPPAERSWAEQRFSESWDPDHDKWGLKDEDHEKIIQTFIDQNYEEIRRFFVVTIPAIARRVSLHEKSKDRASKSDQSK